MQTQKKTRLAAWLGSALALMLSLGMTAAAASEQALKASLAEQKASDAGSAKSQQRIAQLADQTSELIGEYRLALQKLDRVKIYNGHLQTLVNDQESEKANVQRQLEDFQVVQTDIVPLMFNMIDSLGKFIDADLPFNLVERRDRVDRLREMMDDSEITISEKYRKIMEAYQIEVGFGRDMEAVVGDLDVGGEPRKVEFLRIGRILLAYQTANKEETGFWNKNTGQWELLPDEYRSAITEGLRIARKQAAPDLLMLPINGPEAAQ
ncbi:MAG: hypothetical protein AMJ59_03655 [Gammaproteobacteria bacterium SG8_31]|jgi:hypothetical protein|nr:MAG: hypothetical protein AMJ59_03655 [Gammaproteobacteria bacterium SG8_31]